MHHAAAQIGQNMIIYGGIDNRNTTSEDLYLFDIKKRHWSLPDVIICQDPGPRSHATLTPVFHETLKTLYNFSIMTIPSLKQELNIPNSGFYLFGGLNSYGKATNNLFGLYFKEEKAM